MEKIKKSLELTYNCIDSMLVSGKNQDLAVLAKQELHKAFELLKEKELEILEANKELLKEDENGG